MFYSGIVYVLWIWLLCQCTGSGLHKVIITAHLNKPTELVITVSETMCSNNNRVEWIYHRMGSHSPSMCLTYGPEGHQSYGRCGGGRVHFHCHNNSLVFHNVTLDDAGEYVERIITAEGPMKEIHITLNVIGPPHITNLTINSTGHALIMTCEVSGENVSSIWLKDGEALPTHDHHVLQDMNRTLTVHGPTREDRGNYTCRATSDGGTAEAHVNINDPICEDSEEANGRGRSVNYAVLILRPVCSLLGLAIIALCFKRYYSGVWWTKSEIPEDQDDNDML